MVNIIASFISWRGFPWVKYGGVLFLYVAFTILTLISMFYSFASLRGMFEAKRKPHLGYYNLKMSTDSPPYEAYENLDITPDETPTLCKRAFYPLRSTCRSSDYFTLTRGQRTANYTRANVTFIFVPGHCATGSQSMNYYGEIQTYMRRQGVVARNYMMLYFDEEPTAASRDMIEKQSDFLVSLVETIVHEQRDDPTGLVIFGSSLGGTVSVNAAAKRPDLFAGVRAIITLSSPLDDHPLQTSHYISEVYRRVHENSDRLPPVIQLYAGTNDLLVDVFSSRIDQYRNKEKLYVYVPTMRNVFFDILHNELPLSSIVGPPVGSILADYFASYSNTSITEFWKSRTTLPVFNINNVPQTTTSSDSSAAAATIDTFIQRGVSLRAGLTLIPEDSLTGKDELLYYVSTDALSENKSYVFVTTVPSSSVRVLYGADSRASYEEQHDYNFSFEFPEHYHAVPIPAERIKSFSMIYIQIKRVGKVDTFQQRYNYAAKNETRTYYMAFREYRLCTAELGYSSLISGQRIRPENGDCFHYQVSIPSIYPAELRSFSVKVTAKQKDVSGAGVVQLSALILLRQNGVYTSVDFYSHKDQDMSQPVAVEFPYKTGHSDLSLDLFGLDTSLYEYHVEIKGNPLYPLQTLFRAHRFHIANLAFALLILLLIFQLNEYARFRSGNSAEKVQPSVAVPLFKMMVDKAPHLLVVSFAATGVQYAFEPWFRPYGMFGIDYAISERKMNFLSFFYIPMGGLMVLFAICVLISVILLLLSFYANMLYDGFKFLRNNLWDRCCHTSDAETVTQQSSLLFTIFSYLIQTIILAALIYLGLFTSHLLCCGILLILLFCHRFGALAAVSGMRRAQREHGKTRGSVYELDIVGDYAISTAIFVLILYGSIMTMHKLLVEMVIGLKMFSGGFNADPEFFVPFYCCIATLIFFGQKRCLRAFLRLRPVLGVLVGYIAVMGYDYMYRAGLFWVGFMYLYVVVVLVEFVREVVSKNRGEQPMTTESGQQINGV